MRPCPNADVVAELPVVEVVAAAVPRPGKGRDLVVFKAGLTGEILDGATYVPEHFFIGQDRRVCRKGGVGFDRQLVKRKVSGGKIQSGTKIGNRIRRHLSGQAMHQVDVEVVEPGFLDGPTGLFGLFPIMYTPQHAEAFVVETLYAKRKTVDPAITIATESISLG